MPASVATAAEDNTSLRRCELNCMRTLPGVFAARASHCMPRVPTAAERGETSGNIYPAPRPTCRPAAGSFRTMSSPRTLQRQASNNPQPAQYTEHYADIGGLKLHYVDYGTKGKPPMLCVHGGAAHAHWFDYIAPGFTDAYHVRSLDLRGHGDSDAVDPPQYLYSDYAADLDKFVKAIDLRDFVLVGHSMGGTVCLLYAATYPGRVKKLVIVDSTINLSAERIGRLRDIGSRPGRDYDSKEEMVSRYKLRPGESLASPDVVRYIASRSVKETPEGLWRYKFDRSV